MTEALYTVLTVIAFWLGLTAHIRLDAMEKRK